MAGFKNGLRKVGTVWHFKIKFRGKGYHGSTGLADRDDASEWLADFRRRLRQNEIGTPKDPTFAAAYELYLKDNTRICEGSRQSMIHIVTRWVLPILGPLRLSEITPSHIAEVSRKYMSTPSPSGKMHNEGGLTKLLVDVRSVMSWVRQYRGCEHLRPVKIMFPRVQKQPKSVIPLSMVPAFLSAIDEATKDHQVRLAVRVMLLLGLRSAEVSTMRWEWFALDYSAYAPGRTKGREAVEIPVVPILREAVLEWKQEATAYWARQGLPLPPEVFFRVRKPYSSMKRQPQRSEESYWARRDKTFSRGAIQRAAKALGLPGPWGPHKLRHSFATILHQLGVPMVAIQAYLRHKNRKTTELYIHLTLEIQQSARTLVLGKLDALTRPSAQASRAREPEPSPALTPLPGLRVESSTLVETSFEVSGEPSLWQLRGAAWWSPSSPEGQPACIHVLAEPKT